VAANAATVQIDVDAMLCDRPYRLRVRRDQSGAHSAA
jgi:hypothetical protein